MTSGFAVERQTALLAENAGVAVNAAVWAAVSKRPKPHTWREIAPLSGMPWQTLHRRYRQRPARLPRRIESLDKQTIAKLIDNL